jgi:hypothetical protein
LIKAFSEPAGCTACLSIVILDVPLSGDGTARIISQTPSADNRHYVRLSFDGGCLSLLRRLGMLMAGALATALISGWG